MIGWMLLVIGAGIAGLQQPADMAPHAKGSAIVRGLVTDRETGVPMPRAVVSLSVGGGSGQVFQNVTDPDGRFEFLNLPPGMYTVSAAAGEHRASHVREMFNQGPQGSWRAITLKAGEVRADVNFALQRSLAISGRVVDEFGDPLANARLRLTPATRFFGPMGRTRTTDDRGMYRLFGLPPGKYIVCVEVDRHSPAPTTIVAFTDRFVPTCYPSALTEAEAQVVTLGAGDADGIDIRVRRSRTFTISGTVVDATGELASSPMTTLHHFVRSGATSSGSVASDGTFRFVGLLAGEYAVEASVGLRSYDTADTRSPQRGYVPVRLGEHDVTDLVVMMKLPATVRGRRVRGHRSPG